MEPVLIVDGAHEKVAISLADKTNAVLTNVVVLSYGIEGTDSSGDQIFYPWNNVLKVRSA